MNLNEWCAEISKQMGVSVTPELAKDVMMVAIRTGIEELSSNPAEAEVHIHGVGRFYLIRFKGYNGFYHLGKGEESDMYIWMLRFKPSRMMKEVFNNKRPLSDLSINGYYLYPEYHLNEEGYILTTTGQNTGKKITDKEVRHPNEYWYKKIEQIQKGEIRLNPNREFEKRGRPRTKLNINQVSSKVLKEMRRDLRRELRHERQGKITKDDWELARW